MRHGALTIGTSVCLAALFGVALAQEPSLSDRPPRTAAGAAALGAAAAPQPGEKAPANTTGEQLGLAPPDDSSAKPPDAASDPFERSLASFLSLSRRADPEAAIEAMVGLWKAASTDAKRQRIEKALRECLGEQFKARLSAHEKEVAQLEARVKQLRSQLELRREKQDEIVDFRVQQLLRDAQGLGWSSGPGGSAGAMPGMMPGMESGMMPGMPGSMMDGMPGGGMMPGMMGGMPGATEPSGRSGGTYRSSNGTPDVKPRTTPTPGAKGKAKSGR